MFWGVSSKWLKCLGISAFLCFALPSLGQAQIFGTAIGIGSGPCGPTCHQHCPPAYKHRGEGAPHIHFGHGCPHPIANPCELPNWGYYETCWNPWPFPPNWNHCPTPPPAAYVHLNAYGSVPSVMPKATPQTLPPVRNTLPAPPMDGGGLDELPPPRKLDSKRSGLGN